MQYKCVTICRSGEYHYPVRHYCTHVSSIVLSIIIALIFSASY